MSTFSRLCSVARVDQKNGSDDYPEMVGTVTLILGKALGSLEEVAFGAFGAGGGTTLGCFGAFLKEICPRGNNNVIILFPYIMINVYYSC